MGEARLMQVTIIRDLRSLGDYQPGEIGKPFQGEPDHWFIACPECGGRGSLADHTIREHGEDETLSITPSLLCIGNRLNKCTAHYFVNHNQITWV